MAKLNNEELEKYKIGLELALNEGHVLWSFSQSYLIANTIFFAFISQRLDKTFKIQPDLWTFLLALTGLAITILWLASYIRRSDYYKFRINHLKSIEPKGWEFIKGRGEEFSDGKEVEINEKTYQIGLFGRPRTRTASILFIVLFICLYFFILYITCPVELRIK